MFIKVVQWVNNVIGIVNTWVESIGDFFGRSVWSFVESYVPEGVEIIDPFGFLQLSVFEILFSSTIVFLLAFSIVKYILDIVL